MLDAGYWIMDNGYWIQDNGYWMLDGGWRMDVTKGNQKCMPMPDNFDIFDANK